MSYPHPLGPPDPPDRLGWSSSGRVSRLCARICAAQNRKTSGPLILSASLGVVGDKAREPQILSGLSGWPAHGHHGRRRGPNWPVRPGITRPPCNRLLPARSRVPTAPAGSPDGQRALRRQRIPAPSRFPRGVTRIGPRQEPGAAAALADPSWQRMLRLCPDAGYQHRRGPVLRSRSSGRPSIFLGEHAAAANNSYFFSAAARPSASISAVTESTNGIKRLRFCGGGRWRIVRPSNGGSETKTTSMNQQIGGLAMVRVTLSPPRRSCVAVTDLIGGHRCRSRLTRHRAGAPFRSFAMVERR